MTIFGVALLALCTLIGVFLGDLLGIALGVKANVGGVGLAMILLIAARSWLVAKGKLGSGIKLGVEFWSTMYIPIVVAMAAQQNVVAAVKGGPIVLIAATVSLLLCFGCVAFLGRFGRREGGAGEPARPAIDRGGDVIAGGSPDVASATIPLSGTKA
ncbi:malonate transporter subunit MadL [Methylobacterium sp. 77]|uniref:malonate transporter subunit MadL n=1 Tax=Methylobacterium sp. 77 TaxID=1101192 RepID=UPI0003653661|nr:malonate transporter subunit MadL [Methylobacterium sp. 77]